MLPKVRSAVRSKGGMELTRVDNLKEKFVSVSEMVYNNINILKCYMRGDKHDVPIYDFSG